YTYEEVEEIANYLRQKVSIKPQIGIICGTGLGLVGETLTKPTVFEYKDIPNFPVSTVQSHAGRLLFGHVSGVPVVCMQGRFHFYEGYSLAKCVMPVRLMKLLGITTLVISNAAGGINSSYQVGDIMLIKDHVNFVGFAGNNPLRGRNDDKFGPRFLAVNDAYDPQIIKDVKAIAKRLKVRRVHEGVYGCVGGPTFESVAELRAMKVLGVDAVGMSTVHEVIAARHCGLTCFAFSLITNECVMEYETEEQPDHEGILTVASQREHDLKNLIENLVPHLAKTKF
ncbi:purine nucleoside phosphorylase, partial [Asbolus verrucosus]